MWSCNLGIKIHQNECLTSSTASSNCHLPRAFKQFSTKCWTSSFSAITLFLTGFEFTLSTTSKGNSEGLAGFSCSSENIYNERENSLLLVIAELTELSREDTAKFPEQILLLYVIDYLNKTVPSSFGLHFPRVRDSRTIGLKSYKNTIRV